MEATARRVHLALTRIPTALQYAPCAQRASIQASLPKFPRTPALCAPTSRILPRAVGTSLAAFVMLVTLDRVGHHAQHACQEATRVSMVHRLVGSVRPERTRIAKLKLFASNAPRDSTRWAVRLSAPIVPTILSRHLAVCSSTVHAMKVTPGQTA